jgi:hypothetical protein
MQPSLQAALFTGVGLKRAESTFTASGLLIPSSGLTVLGNVSLRTLPALRGSKSRRVTRSAYRLIRLSLARVSPENALFPRNTRCKISHCQNFDLKTSFMNVISYLWCNEGEFAPTRETRLALSFDSNLFGFVT